MRKNKRAKITAGVQLNLWPDKNGILQIVGARVVSSINLYTGPRSVVRESSSPRSRLLQRVQRGKTSRAQSFFSSSLWRSLKSRIDMSFNQATDFYFSNWLTVKIQDAEYNVLTLRAVVRLALDELELEPDQIKRLIIKLTRASGEFCSDGQFLTLR